MNVTRQMARNVLETSFEAFDRETVEQARYRVIDVIGCIIGGAKAPGCNIMVDLIKKWGGSFESSVLVHGFKAPAQHAAMVNSIMCRSFDFEPVGPYVHGVNIPAHVSGTTVPAALAVAEQKAASGRELITALVLGDDITSRILAASRYFFDAGWDGTGTVNTFGAAAIAGRLQGLDEKQMVEALGIAVNQMAGSFQNIYDASLSFKLPMGLAARNGIFSAELAARGFTAMEDPLESKNGYFKLYCHSHDSGILTRDLGEKFFADRTFKPYPACRSTHGAIDCALQIVREHEIDPDGIEKITVDVTEATRDMFVGQPFRIREIPQVDATFSLRYNVANALLRKSVRLEHFTEEYVTDRKIAGLIDKVELLATLPPDKHLATRVDVKMKNGETFSAYTDTPRGDGLYNPVSVEELKEKFRANTAFSGAIPIERAEKALAMLVALEEIPDITEIIRQIG